MPGVHNGMRGRRQLWTMTGPGAGVEEEEEEAGSIGIILPEGAPQPGQTDLGTADWEKPERP